jgi:hypothetical protein
MSADAAGDRVFPGAGDRLFEVDASGGPKAIVPEADSIEELKERIGTLAGLVVSK